MSIPNANIATEPGSSGQNNDCRVSQLETCCITSVSSLARKCFLKCNKYHCKVHYAFSALPLYQINKLIGTTHRFTSEWCNSIKEDVRQLILLSLSIHQMNLIKKKCPWLVKRLLKQITNQYYQHWYRNRYYFPWDCDGWYHYKNSTTWPHFSYKQAR